MNHRIIVGCLALLLAVLCGCGRGCTRDPEALVEVPAARRADDLRTRQEQATIAAATAEARGDTAEAQIQTAIANRLAQLAGEQEHVAQAQRAELAELRAAEERRAEDLAAKAQARRFGAYGIVAAVLGGALLLYLKFPPWLAGGASVAVAGTSFLVAAWWTSAAWIAPVIGGTLLVGSLIVAAALVRRLMIEWQDKADALKTAMPDAATATDDASRQRQTKPMRLLVNNLLHRGKPSATKATT